VCLEVSPAFGEIAIAQPVGFRTNFRARDFEGSFEWAPTAISARMSPQINTLTTANVGRSTLESGRGRVYVVNDNGGSGYRFAPVQNWTGLISVDLTDSPRSKELQLPEPDRSAIETVALAAVQTTDILLIGIRERIAGINLDPRFVSKRASWYSLGFLLRESATRLLDVQSSELRVGLRVIPVGGEATGQIFLADSLENGAGYATFLGSPGNFAGVITEAQRYLEGLRQIGHSRDCDSSCYDCLRDYYNMPYHPLLDWRLAADLFSLLEGHELKAEASAEQERRLADSFARDFGGSVVGLDGNCVAVDLGHVILIVTHPLEDTRFASLPLRLASAVADAESRGFGGFTEKKILFRDTFDLLRRPGGVAAEIL
jgi:hypothetical protein